MSWVIEAQEDAQDEILDVKKGDRFLFDTKSEMKSYMQEMFFYYTVKFKVLGTFRELTKEGNLK